MNLLRRMLLLLVLALALPAQAHEIRPVFLGLQELADGSIEARLKLPLFRSGDVAAVQVRFAPDCRNLAPAENSIASDSLLQRWRLRCASGLAGQRIELQGFSVLVPDGLVTARFADGREASYAVNREHAELQLMPQAGAHPASALSAYVPIGIEHIMLGFDHLLFVLGLMLLWWRSGSGLRRLIGTVTAFTLAHSLTLALSVLGGVTLPPAPVEALIALSILLLAVELVRAARLAPALPDTLVFRKPWLIAFSFGLLHGFGFAGALRETGLPEQARAWALLLFNVGVELGQLLFIAAAALLYAVLRRLMRVSLTQLSPVLNGLIGSVSAAWWLDRTWQIFGG